MKRTKLSLLALAIAIPLGMTQCTDPDEPENPVGPFGGEVVNYNINDFKIEVGSDVYEPITADNWREQGSMFLYVGNNDADQSIHDSNNRTGYRLVNLPWAKGTVQSNLPVGFCHDIIPENGWEWVFNLCGNRSTENGNFFAVYNKYSGILRFFFYMPSQFSAGNDHYWQVTLSDHLAKSSVWRYGLPYDRSIVKKSALGQTTGAFIDYITPWTSTLSQDGLIVPNAGWWAFDVDMSQTRTDNILPDDVIKLQMCSWNTQHISLASTIAANIDGSLQAQFDITKTTVSAAKGLTESLGDIAGVGKDAYSAIAGAMSGDIGKALSSAFSFAKGAYSVYGAMTKETEVITDTLGKGNITGAITMALNGNIDTEGIIKGSEPVSGINPVSLLMKDFDREHSHLGQGTWNLKVTPVVYRMPYYYCTQYYVGYSNPIWDSYYWWPYVFNPNSIEVELNPNVFPEEDIEWMQVDALCVSRKSMNDISMDNIRMAFGLQSCINNNAYFRNMKTICPDFESADDPVANFAYAWDDDNLGMEPGYAPIYNITETRYYSNRSRLHTEVLAGVGADGACIEPVYEWCAGESDLGNKGEIWRLPFLEVNVKVLVKMKGMDKPILLCRNYLPEFKEWDASEFESSIQEPKPYADKMEGRNQLREYQNKRIYDYSRKIYDGSLLNYVCTNGSAAPGDYLEYSYPLLVDGDPSTFWASSKQDNVFFVEFYARNPLQVTSYTLTTASGQWMGYEYEAKYNPKAWKLYAKKSQDDEWTLIDERADGQLPTEPKASKAYEVSNVDTWQYFRYEATEVVTPNNNILGDILLLGELELNSD